ncbi:MAG: sulfatase-like hydrolase/transferase, partial [Promethearchaeota archaeon]
MSRKRQIILIITDTQRKDMVGCYGNPDLHTPNLDRMAGKGVRFENAYCCQPVCGPARSAMFTGTFPHSNGSWANT